jgi:hypothetical protein
VQQRVALRQRDHGFHDVHRLRLVRARRRVLAGDGSAVATSDGLTFSLFRWVSRTVGLAGRSASVRDRISACVTTGATGRIATHRAAFAVQDLAPYGLGASRHVFAGYEVLFTRQAIPPPEFEVNAHGRSDPARRMGSGVSDAQLRCLCVTEIRR